MNLKATVKWKDWFTKKRYQKTFKVDKNEPNRIVEIARKCGYMGAEDYIYSIKCGRYEYLNYGTSEWVNIFN